MCAKSIQLRMVNAVCTCTFARMRQAQKRKTRPRMEAGFQHGAMRRCVLSSSGSTSDSRNTACSRSSRNRACSSEPYSRSSVAVIAGRSGGRGERGSDERGTGSQAEDGLAEHGGLSCEGCGAHILIVSRALSGKGSKPPCCWKNPANIIGLRLASGAAGRRGRPPCRGRAHGYKPLAPIPGLISHSTLKDVTHGDRAHLFDPQAGRDRA